jgi:hypothetical protein
MKIIIKTKFKIGDTVEIADSKISKCYTCGHTTTQKKNKQFKVDAIRVDIGSDYEYFVTYSWLFNGFYAEKELKKVKP